MKNVEGIIRKSTVSDEESQLENLKRYKILYTKSEPVFDQLAAFTATMLNTPIALINFVDQDSVWMKAGQNGLLRSEFEDRRGTSLCALAIINESVTAFERFAKQPGLIANALIAGESGLQFYAAVPITTDEGFNVGTVCIADKKHRQFLPHEQKQLEWIASMVRIEMNKRVAEKMYA